MKTRIFAMMSLMILLFVACGTTEEASQQSSDETVATSVAEIQTAEEQNQPVQEEASPGELQGQEGIQLQQLLAVGIVRLDDTDYDISPEQAGTQLLLWKTLASLTGADNVTVEEIDAVYSQIQDTLTADQITAINAMDLSFEDMSETFPDLEFGQAGGFGNLTPEEQATRQAQSESGDFTPPEGFTRGQGGPGGGQGFGGGQAPPDGVIPGAGNGDGEGRPGGDLGRFGTELIDEIIIFLEERSAQ